VTLPRPLDEPIIKLFEKGILFARFLTGLKHSTVVKFLTSVALVAMFFDAIVEKSYFWAFVWSGGLLLTQFDDTLEEKEATADRSQMPVRGDGKDSAFRCFIRLLLLIGSFCWLPTQLHRHDLARSIGDFATTAFLYLISCDIYPSSGNTLRSWIKSKLARRVPVLVALAR
jgi:hypothetical protein